MNKKPHLQKSITLLVLVVLLVPSVAILSSPAMADLAASTWPMFRHDLQHTGRSPYLGPQTNAIMWSYATGGPVFSSPAIGSDGTIYVGSGDYNLYAINPDGNLKWSYTADNQTNASPYIDSNGMVYVGSDNSNIYAINPDGSLKWSYPTGGRVLSSTAVDNFGIVYVGSYDQNIYAINPDGSLKWSYPTGYLTWSSPAIGSDGTIYIGSGDNNLYAINPNGSLKWFYTTGSHIDSSPAIGSDGTIYVGSHDHNIYAINPDGSLKWSYITGDTVVSSPAIGSDGTIYVGSFDHNIYAINPDGSLKWSYATDEWIWSSPTIDYSGTIYVGSDDHNIYAINSDGSLKWFYATGDWVRSSPVIDSDGTLYVGSYDGKLYAFGLHLVLPTVITNPAINITTTSASLNGNLSSLGTFDNAIVSFQMGTSPGIYTDNTTPQLKSAIGTFSQNLMGLNAKTTYYYRAQATSNGNTVYGAELSFTTSGVPWQITTSTNTGTLTLVSNLGNITSLSAISVQTPPNLPPLLIFPHGLMYFEVSNIEPGSTVIITITFPVALPSNIQYWKYQPARGFFQIPITSQNGNVITIQIIDGGLGDADGLANGVIIDPGGVAIPSTPAPVAIPANPSIGTGAPTSHGSSFSGTAPTTKPVGLLNIVTQSARLSAKSVTPGTPITVTADIANKSGVNGNKKVTLYVNGQVETTQNITVNSGGSNQLAFNVSRSEPGDYNVYVDGVSAGSFKVELFRESDGILIFSIVLLAGAFVVGLIMLWRRRQRIG